MTSWCVWLSYGQANLRHYMSNESLTLFPDFQQRLGESDTSTTTHLCHCRSQLTDLCLWRQACWRRWGTSTPTRSCSSKVQTPTSALSVSVCRPASHSCVCCFAGRVACDVNTCEELLLAEIVFENVLDPLTPAEIAGLLSALVCQVGTVATIPASGLSLVVFLVSRVIGGARGDQCECCRGVRWLQEKSQDEPSVSSSPALHEACKKVKDMARFLGHVMVSERAPDVSHELNTATAAHWRNHEPAPCR